jgi:hypothetical protein
MLNTGRRAGRWAAILRAWRENSLAMTASATLFVGLIVIALQASVALDASVDMPGFLGGDAAYQAHALAQWQIAHVTNVAVLARVIDLVLFIAAYGAFLFCFADAVTQQLGADGALAQRVIRLKWKPRLIRPGPQVRFSSP